MTPHRLVCHALDYQRIIQRAGAKLSEQTIRYSNGLVEYLAVQIELAQGSDCPACPPPGTPFMADLVTQEDVDASPR